MKLYFTFKELCITNDPIPQEVAQKLMVHHIIPMSGVRQAFGSPITASQRSGYRNPAWELRHGRNGQSEHCFKGLGAIDWTAQNLDRLQELIIAQTQYTRIARYAGFIHCDYKPNPNGLRILYSSDAQSQWRVVRTL